MATRKKPPAPAQQSSLFAFPSLTTSPRLADAVPPTQAEVIKQVEAGAALVANAPITPTSLPLVVDEERKLRVVPQPDITPDEDVVVETDGKRFAVSLIRHHGGSVATVIYSRKQLEMLLARIPAALEIA